MEDNFNEIKAGDIVKHIPSGENWVVCGVSQTGKEKLIACGYPFPTFADISDCKLIKSGTGQSEDMKDALRRNGYVHYIDGYAAQTKPTEPKYKTIQEYINALRAEVVSAQADASAASMEDCEALHYRMTGFAEGLIYAAKEAETGFIASVGDDSDANSNV